MFSLPKTEQAQLTKESQIIDLEPNQVIVRQGDLLENLLVIISGQVNAYSHSPSKSPLHLAQYSEGTMLGWLSVIDHQPIDMSLVSASKARLLLVPVKLAMQLLLNSKELMARVLSEMAGSIRQYATEKKLLSVPSAQQRVYIQLFQIASSPTSQTQIPKQEDLAKLVNTSRETVSRALQILIKKGVITKRGHQIVIKDVDQLQKAATTGSA